MADDDRGLVAQQQNRLPDFSAMVADVKSKGLDGVRNKTAINRAQMAGHAELTSLAQMAIAALHVNGNNVYGQALRRMLQNSRTDDDVERAFMEAFTAGQLPVMADQLQRAGEVGANDLIRLLGMSLEPDPEKKKWWQRASE